MLSVAFEYSLIPKLAYLVAQTASVDLKIICKLLTVEGNVEGAAALTLRLMIQVC